MSTTRQAGETCSVQGCERNILATGLCHPHYHQRRKERMPECSVQGCTGRELARGWCVKHYNRWQVHGSVDLRPEPPKPIPLVWHGPDLPTYSAVHGRLRRERGSASNQRCEDCGHPAQTWAYDYAGTSEYRDQRGRRYSPDLRHYRALCQPCHTAHDAEHGDLSHGWGWQRKQTA